MLKEFLKYVIPSALAMFVSSLYTIIDGIFVGQGVGDSALAAVNIVLPFTILLFGIATMFAVGGGALVSKNFGSNQHEEGVRLFRQVILFVLGLTCLISLVCILFTPQIVRALGATEHLVSLSTTYLRYYALFCIPNLIGIVLNSFVRNDGNPKLAMIATISGALTNILLDYLFIFPLGLGIKGAAIATGLGQIVTVGIVLTHFLRGKGVLRFGVAKLNYSEMKEVISIGFPSFFAEAAFSIIIFIHNLVIANFIGEIGLSAYSIINYINTNIYMVLLGLTFGVQPLISYNFGAKNSEKMLGYYKLTLSCSLIVTTAFTLSCIVFGKGLISIFTQDQMITNLTYFGLNMANIGFYFIGFNLTTTVYYQAIEKPKVSNYICLLRSIIFTPICLIILAKTGHATAIWFGLLASEFATFVTVKFIANVIDKTISVIDDENHTNHGGTIVEA